MNSQGALGKGGNSWRNSGVEFLGEKNEGEFEGENSEGRILGETFKGKFYGKHW